MTTQYVREGECNGCGLCCLISHKAVKVPMKDNQHSDYLDRLREGWRIARRTRTHILLAKWDPCPYLTFDLRCSIHGKPEQPEICRIWPGDPQPFYKLVQPHCGFRFRRKKEGEE